MKLYLNMQLTLVCYSSKEAILRSLSDLITVSCSVYPADISVQICIKYSHAHLGAGVSMHAQAYAQCT